jgi:hypothetical protein
MADFRRHPAHHTAKQSSAPWPGPDLEGDFDCRALVSELHDVTWAQVDDAVDAPAIDERAVAASEVHEHESHAAVMARDDPRMVASNVGVAC